MEIKRDEGKGLRAGTGKVGRGNMAENVREPGSYTHPLEVRGGELRNRLGSLYRALCQKEGVEKILLHFNQRSSTLRVRPLLVICNLLHIF